MMTMTIIMTVVVIKRRGTGGPFFRGSNTACGIFERSTQHSVSRRTLGLIHQKLGNPSSTLSVLLTVATSPGGFTVFICSNLQPSRGLCVPFVLADTNSDWIVRRVLPAMAAFSRARVIGPIVSSRAFLGGDSNASYICRCYHYYYYHRSSFDVHLMSFRPNPQCR